MEKYLHFLPDDLRLELIRNYLQKEQENSRSESSIFDIPPVIEEIVDRLNIRDCCEILYNITSSEEGDQQDNFIRDMFECFIFRKIINDHPRWARWIAQLVLENFGDIYEKTSKYGKIALLKALNRFEQGIVENKYNYTIPESEA